MSATFLLVANLLMVSADQVDYAVVNPSGVDLHVVPFDFMGDLSSLGIGLSVGFAAGYFFRLSNMSSYSLLADLSFDTPCLKYAQESSRWTASSVTLSLYPIGFAVLSLPEKRPAFFAQLMFGVQGRVRFDPSRPLLVVLTPDVVLLLPIAQRVALSVHMTPAPFLGYAPRDGKKVFNMSWRFGVRWMPLTQKT